MSELPVLRTVAALRGAVAKLRAAGRTIALVPTMGALHDGHISLGELAKARGAAVVYSIFVNPTQFAPHEDFARYPRDERADALLLATEDVADLIYAPTAEEMYPAGFETQIAIGGPTAGLETDFRPHFFGGVGVVVAKLLLQALPDFAVFGEKDYQQLQVIRRMVRDLDIPVEIVGAPTQREADGLAMSSRNARLSPQDRAAAPALYAALTRAAQRLRGGEDPAPVLEAAREEILAGGFARVEYLDLRAPESLALLDRRDGPARLLAAAWLGPVRLIDNVAV